MQKYTKLWRRFPGAVVLYTGKDTKDFKLDIIEKTCLNVEFFNDYPQMFPVFMQLLSEDYPF